MNKAFEDNNFRELIKTDPERQREIARSGGIKSGEVRKKKAQRDKQLRALMDITIGMRNCGTPEEYEAFKRWKRRHKKRKKRS